MHSEGGGPGGEEAGGRAATHAGRWPAAQSLPPPHLQQDEQAGKDAGGLAKALQHGSGCKQQARNRAAPQQKPAQARRKGGDARRWVAVAQQDCRTVPRPCGSSCCCRHPRLCMQG